MWCGQESNLRHRDFQSLALPTELPHQVKIMVGFPLHPTLYCFLSFTSAWQRELISLTQTRLSTAYLEKPIIFVAYVGFEPLPTIHALLVTCTRAHDCTVLSKSTLFKSYNSSECVFVSVKVKFVFGLPNTFPNCDTKVIRKFLTSKYF